MSMIDFIGKKLGNVTIEKLLHQGGYGNSYIGFDESLEKSRVIKICQQPIDTGDSGNREMEDFINEGLILSRLNHAQIVSIIEHGEAFGHRYMILNYIKGPSLVTLIQSLNGIKKEYECSWENVLDPHLALALAISCLKPLAYAHETRIELPNQEVQNGIAHRDISPSNLILGTGSELEGKVHLIDFGTAKTGVDLMKTMHAKIIGSPKYLSPMRLIRPRYEGKNETEYWKTFKQSQHDIHAMGCIFIELLTGKPFILIDRDISGCLQAIVNPQTYKDLYARIKIYDPSIQRLIKESVLLPDVENNKGGYQYKTAKEMLEAFEKVFYRLSGFAEHEKVLVDFSRRIENLDNFEPVLEKQSTVKKHTKTGHIKSGKREYRERPP